MDSLIFTITAAFLNLASIVVIFLYKRKVKEKKLVEKVNLYIFPLFYLLLLQLITIPIAMFGYPYFLKIIFEFPLTIFYFIPVYTSYLAIKKESRKGRKK